jgi:hypothetical protein
LLAKNKKKDLSKYFELKNLDSLTNLIFRLRKESDESEI